jgi:transposase
VTRERLVFFVDECHLRHGDALGYVWGPVGQRVSVPITNVQERQTYYGALDIFTARAVTWPAPCGDSEQTVRFLKSLRRRFQGRPMLLLWDGASYHRSACVQAYLQQVNGSRPEEEWRIHCLTFAPNAPQQNPIEEVWLAGKTAVRQAWQQLGTFTDVKRVFQQHIDMRRFEFEKLNWYGRSQLI